MEHILNMYSYFCIYTYMQLMYFCMTVMIHLTYIYIYLYIHKCMYIKKIYILQRLLIPFWYPTATSDDVSSFDRLRPCQTAGCPSGILEGGGSNLVWRTLGFGDLGMMCGFVWKCVCVCMCVLRIISCHAFSFLAGTSFLHRKCQRQLRSPLQVKSPPSRTRQSS